MNFKPTALIVSIALATGVASAQTQPPAGAGPGMPLTAAQQQSMVELQEAANRLRESIAAMKDKANAVDRHLAVQQAQEALIATQRAMSALPAEIRNAPAAATTTVKYRESVEKMMRAADSLRESIQAMAKLPPGDARNDAIRQANQALLETNAAMVMAYAPGTGTGAMGAAGSASGASGTSSTGTLGSGAGMAAIGGDGKPPAAQGSDPGGK